MYIIYIYISRDITDQNGYCHLILGAEFAQNIAKLVFRNKELWLARKLNFGKFIVLKNKICNKVAYISIYSQMVIYSKIGGGTHPHLHLPLPLPKLPVTKWLYGFIYIYICIYKTI